MKRKFVLVVGSGLFILAALLFYACNKQLVKTNNQAVLSSIDNAKQYFEENVADEKRPDSASSVKNPWAGINLTPDWTLAQKRLINGHTEVVVPLPMREP